MTTIILPACNRRSPEDYEPLFEAILKEMNEGGCVCVPLDTEDAKGIQRIRNANRNRFVRHSELRYYQEGGNLYIRRREFNDEVI